MTLLDTSFLFALTNTRDRNHDLAVALRPKLSRPLLLPVPVLPELCYLLDRRMGHHVMRQFLRALNGSEIRLLSPLDDDIVRVVSLLDQYADSRLDFADASIVALAERHNVVRIATFDRRDFSIIRPRHTPAFELLP